jgi:hypothetical protein
LLTAPRKTPSTIAYENRMAGLVICLNEMIRPRTRPTSIAAIHTGPIDASGTTNAVAAAARAVTPTRETVLTTTTSSVITSSRPVGSGSVYVVVA